MRRCLRAEGNDPDDQCIVDIEDRLPASAGRSACWPLPHFTGAAARLSDLSDLTTRYQPLKISPLFVAFQLASAQPQPAPLIAPDLPPAIAKAAEPAPSSSADIGDPPSTTVNSAGPPHRPDGADSIVVTARPRKTPGDPLQGLNNVSFDTAQAVDSVVTGPVAMTYKKVLPRPVRSGLRNILSNLQEPIVFVNYMLQLKPGKGAETIGRFAINSTIGVSGMVDVAKRRPFNLPHQINGFAYTLGYYGVGPGPYMYLPLIGPTTVRDLVGRVGDLTFLPLAVGGPFNDPVFGLSTTAVRLVDERAESDEEQRKLFETKRDPYAAVRENYLRKRQGEIDRLRGRTVPATPAAIAPNGNIDSLNSSLWPAPLAPDSASPPLPPTNLLPSGVK